MSGVSKAAVAKRQHVEGAGGERSCWAEVWRTAWAAGRPGAIPSPGTDGSCRARLEDPGTAQGNQGADPRAPQAKTGSNSPSPAGGCREWSCPVSQEVDLLQCRPCKAACSMCHACMAATTASMQPRANELHRCQEPGHSRWSNHQNSHRGPALKSCTDSSPACPQAALVLPRQRTSRSLAQRWKGRSVRTPCPERFPSTAPTRCCSR